MPGGGAGLAERRASRIGDESAWRLTFFSFPRFKRIDAQKLSAVFLPGHNYRGHGPPPPAGAVGAGPARDVVIPFAPPPYPPNPSMPAVSLPLGQFVAHQLQGKQLVLDLRDGQSLGVVRVVILGLEHLLLAIDEILVVIDRPHEGSWERSQNNRAICIAGMARSYRRCLMFR